MCRKGNENDPIFILDRTFQQIKECAVEEPPQINKRHLYIQVPSLVHAVVILVCRGNSGMVRGSQI